MDILNIIIKQYPGWLPEADVTHISTGVTTHSFGITYKEAIQDALNQLNKRLLFNSNQFKEKKK